MTAQPPWFVTCSCGWTREAISERAATAIAKLHVRLILSAPEQEHTFTIEEAPSEDGAGPAQLPLV